MTKNRLVGRNVGLWSRAVADVERYVSEEQSVFSHRNNRGHPPIDLPKWIRGLGYRAKGRVTSDWRRGRPGLDSPASSGEVHLVAEDGL